MATLDLQYCTAVELVEFSAGTVNSVSMKNASAFIRLRDALKRPLTWNDIDHSNISALKQFIKERKITGEVTIGTTVTMSPDSAVFSSDHASNSPQAVNDAMNSQLGKTEGDSVQDVLLLLKNEIAQMSQERISLSNAVADCKRIQERYEANQKRSDEKIEWLTSKVNENVGNNSTVIDHNAAQSFHVNGGRQTGTDSDPTVAYSAGKPTGSNPQRDNPCEDRILQCIQNYVECHDRVVTGNQDHQVNYRSNSGDRNSRNARKVVRDSPNALNNFGTTVPNYTSTGAYYTLSGTGIYGNPIVSSGSTVASASPDQVNRTGYSGISTEPVYSVNHPQTISSPYLVDMGTVPRSSQFSVGINAHSTPRMSTTENVGGSLPRHHRQRSAETTFRMDRSDQVGGNIGSDSPPTYQTSAKPPARRLPTFDGKGNIRTFLVQFENLVKLYRWNAEAADRFSDCLQGTAADYYAGLPSVIRTNYSELKKKFLSYYGDDEPLETLRDQLRDMKQVVDQSITEFAQQISIMAHRAYPDCMDEAERCGVRAFLRGCNHKEIAYQIMVDPPVTIDKALESYRQFTSVHRTIYGKDKRVRALVAEEPNGFPVCAITPDSDSTRDIGKLRKDLDHLTEKLELLCKLQDQKNKCDDNTKHNLAWNKIEKALRQAEENARANSDLGARARSPSRASSGRFDHSSRNFQSRSRSNSGDRGQGRSRSSSPARSEGCFQCGDRNHFARDCPTKNANNRAHGVTFQKSQEAISNTHGERR